MDVAEFSPGGAADLSGFLQFIAGRPAEMLGFIGGGLEDVEEVGTEDVRGVETTHYSGTVDLEEAAKPRTSSATCTTGSSRTPSSRRSRPSSGSTRTGLPPAHLRDPDPRRSAGAEPRRWRQEFYDFGDGGGGRSAVRRAERSTRRGRADPTTTGESRHDRHYDPSTTRARAEEDELAWMSR